MSDTIKPKFRYVGYEPDRRRYESVKAATLLDLFRSGLDTDEIAVRCQNTSEATIYNALSQAREAERSCRG